MAELTPEQWRRVKSLFDEASEVPTEQRAEYVDEHCADDDTAVRTQLASMLDLRSRAEGFLSAPAPGVPRPTNGHRDQTGRRIGPYRLLQRIGAGGMGSVWLAERDDEHFARQVAIKLIRRGMDTDEILERFKHERQVLARLEHPNIARLYDGGATEDGRPYLVMEHVDGKPVDLHCDEGRLSIDERLALFRKVCLAVHYAHQNLVVHRDLKPGNILVVPPADATGGSSAAEPKLLDFGIAKVLGAEGSARTIDLTVTEARLLTPRYASPEQIRGNAVTTASDVYSLGVILYELLTGRSPYEPTSRSRLEFERAICERDPLRPSTAATRPWQRAGDDGTTRTIAPETLSAARSAEPRGLKRRLGGDLDTIVLMALRKEPERRYASAEQLAEDIRRHGDGLPVAARPDTVFYRSSKFVKRNRLAVGAAVAVLLVIIAALIASSALFVRAEGARRIAEQAEAVARRRAYAAGIQAASAAIESRQIRLARSQLDIQPEELRGWEWSVLQNQLDRSEARLVAAGEPTGYAALSMSRDGELLAAGGFDGRVRTWDRRTGAQLNEFGRHTLWARSIALLADGERVAVGEGSWIGGRMRGHAAIRLWNIETGEPAGVLEGHADSIQSLALSPDGTLLASGSSDATVRIWDVASPELPAEPVAVLLGHTDEVRNLAWSPDQEELASVSWDGTARVWSTSGWSSIRVIRTEPTVDREKVSSVAYAPNGAWMATGSRDGRVRLWNRSDWALIETIEFHGNRIATMAFAPDSSRLYTGSTDNSVGSLDLIEWQDHRAWLGHVHDANALAVTGDGAMVYSAGADGVIRQWRSETAAVAIVRTSPWLTGLAIAPDGRRLALQRIDGSGARGDPVRAFVDILTIDDRRVVERIPLHPAQGINDLGWSPDGSLLAVAAGDRAAIIWSAAASQLVEIEKIDRAISWSVAFDRDGRQLAIASDDGRIRFYETEHWTLAGEPIPCIASPKAVVDILPDRRLLTIDPEGMPALWDIATRTRIGAPLEPERLVANVIAGPDGDEAIIGLSDGAALLWDLSSNRVVAELGGHGGAVINAVWSPDGSRLMTSTMGGVIKIWSRDHLEELLTLRPGAQRMDMTPDGRWLIAGGPDGSVRFWDGAPPDRPAPRP